MKTRLPRLLFVALVVLATSIPIASSQANASGPFRCQPGFYQVILGQLNILNPLTGVYSPIGSGLDTYNAIGFNPVDNYIYGWGTAGNHSGNILKIDSSGTVTLMGNAGQTGPAFISGDFDDEGFLWMRKNATTMVKVDVRTNPATSVDVTFTGANLIGADMGWINDSLYSVDGPTLMRADLNSQTVTHIGIGDAGNSPSGKEFPGTGSYGAIFSNRSDELYASNNATGRIYRITDFNTSSPLATWVVDATVTSNNDGAACKLAPSPFDSPTSTDDSYTVTNDQTLNVDGAGVFINDGASTPTITSHTVPSSGTLTLNSNGSFTYVPETGFVGTVTFSYVGTDQWGRTMPAATVTITVSNPVGTTSTATPSPTTTTAPVVESLPESGWGIQQTFFLSILLVAFGIVIFKPRSIAIGKK